MTNDKGFSSFMSKLTATVSDKDKSRLTAHELLANPSASHFSVANEGVVPSLFKAYAKDVTDLPHAVDMMDRIGVVTTELVGYVNDDVVDDRLARRLVDQLGDLMMRRSIANILKSMPMGTDRHLVVFLEERNVTDSDPRPTTFLVWVLFARNVDKKENVSQVESLEVLL